MSCDEGEVTETLENELASLTSPGEPPMVVHRMLWQKINYCICQNAETGSGELFAVCLKKFRFHLTCFLYTAIVASGNSLQRKI